MTLRELLPSLSSPDDARALWPGEIHTHGGRLCVRSDGRAETFLDDLCDEYGDAVAVRAGTAVVTVTRVRSVDVYRGLLRVVTTGADSGVAPVSVRVASRHPVCRPVPCCLCTRSGRCVCPALDLPSDIHAGDVLAMVTRCGDPAFRGPTVCVRSGCVERE